MIVLGGGPVGSELAQAWSTLGTKVTLVEGEDRLLPREEPFAGEEVAASLRESYGIDVRTGVLAERVSRGGDGGRGRARRRRPGRGGGAAGRDRPHAPHRAASASTRPGVEPGEHGFLETDDRLRVGGRDWLYAIGDVNGRALLTHMGKYQAWVAAENMLGREVEAIAEGLGSPRVTFTDPQVAAAGRTLAQAREAGIDAKAIDVPTDGTAGASFQGKDTGGTSRLVIDREPGKTIVGATFTGFETADFLHAATIAIVGEVPARTTAPRGRRLPDAQRDLAEAARGLRALSQPGGVKSDPRAPLQVFRELPRQPRYLVQFVDRLEPAHPLAVGEQAGRLGDREAVATQLLEGDVVQFDRLPRLRRGRRRRLRLRWLPVGTGAGGAGPARRRARRLAAR